VVRRQPAAPAGRGKAEEMTKPILSLSLLAFAAGLAVAAAGASGQASDTFVVA